MYRNEENYQYKSDFELKSMQQKYLKTINVNQILGKSQYIK